MAARKPTLFVILTWDKEKRSWVEQSVAASGNNADAALLAALDNTDLELADGDLVSLVPKRSWRPVKVTVKTQLKIELDREFEQ